MPGAGGTVNSGFRVQAGSIAPSSRAVAPSGMKMAGSSSGPASISTSPQEERPNRSPLSGRPSRRPSQTLGQLALAGTDLSELMNALVRAVAGHLGVKYAKVLRYLPDEDAFLLEAAVGFNETRVGKEKVEGGTDSQAGYTLLSHEPVIVEDLRTETRFTGPALLRDEGIVSGISVIIQGKRAPYGVLGAHTRTHRRFTQDDINFIQAAANILAQAIERRATEEALLASEEKFRAIAQRSFDMIYTCYHDSGIAYISPPRKR